MTQVKEDTRQCRDCGEAITYIPESERFGRNDPQFLHGWRHTATGNAWGGDGVAKLENHLAAPTPRCPKCQSPRYATHDTPWGIQSDCPDCKYSFYVSIGD